MILVLTYAKVCTTSLYHLLTKRFPGDVFRSHGLTAWTHEPLEAFVEAASGNTAGLRTVLDNAASLERLDRARTTGETVTLISGVRDPIARSLSVAMQNLEVAFADCLGPSAEATAEAVAARVCDLWLRDTPDGDPGRTFLERMIRAPLYWFEEEIRKPFGFDLPVQAFDRAQGYSILTRDNFRLLLFRHDNAPAAIEKGLAELFPGMDVTLPHDNIGVEKPTSDIYRAVQDCFRLPRSALETIYAHPDVSAYFGEDEIVVAIDRWAEVAPHRSWAPPLPPAAPRQAFVATVFIPLHNHAEWIGAQLDSLFSQWRTDLELLLIDDGSADCSLAVALERLAGRPEVAATVMRNGKAIGHGMVPIIAELSRAPLLIQADSDDIALPGRLDAIVEHFAAHPDCKLLTSNAVLLNESGVPVGLLDARLPDAVIDDPIELIDLQNEIYWLGATSAFHRSIVEAFPPLDPELVAYGLDLLTGFRATLLGSHHYLARPMVGWRQHSRNSHRLITAGEDPAAMEHLAALQVMVRAQRLRDLRWLHTQGMLNSARAAAIDARWQADFMAKADEWIRLRNRLTGTHATPRPRAAAGTTVERLIAPTPPIVTLQRGLECPVEQIDRILSRWPGVYQNGGPSVWTGRQAVIVLRIPDPEARTLVVTLAGLPYFDRQTVFLSVDFGSPIETTLIAGQARRVSVPISRRASEAGDLVSLMFSVPEASTPETFDPSNRDPRILGVALFAFRVI
ncbi:hypothetical protein MSC49_40890 (plasmid) [Methylosinus sp. C49]|uniref:putative capsular polysaccharide synthesis family protein n=1 Tax=Methylosinus sp. C49 TaxID=2699395 RepID=UPI00136698A3|nr:putative capsular polysaccharide synthesis family protein [Methylosinus sp. C49]BBU64154.1 hypothetical protein MSC49_40890 [Methylosinus sp. C49]